MSFFAAAFYFRQDRGRLEQQFRYLAENGVDYIRAFGTLAEFPSHPPVDPRWPEWRALIEGVTDLAWDCGLRTQWTAFGDAQIMAPSMDDKRRVVQTISDITSSRREKVIALEIANESWQNGVSRDELRDLARLVASRVDVPVALSCPAGEGKDAFADGRKMYEGSAATFSTHHYPRTMGDDGWRPPRQPWEIGEYEGTPPAHANGEPIGIGQPGGSNPTDDNPHRQVTGVLISWLTGHWGHCLHDRAAGVVGDRDWSQVSNIDSILGGVRVLKRLLPADFPSWSKQQDGASGHPFENVPNWVDPGESSGVVRFYASTKDGKFIAPPFGIKGGVTVTARWNMNVEGFDILTGDDVVPLRELGAGQSIRLDDDPPVYLLRGARR